MPIKIYNQDTWEELDILCYEVWDLPTQVHELEKWAFTVKRKIKKGKYVADIGFDIQKDSKGGGAVLNSEILKIFGDLGIEIHLSEYPGIF